MSTKTYILIGHLSGKPLVWLGRSRTDVRRFPRLVRRLVGFQLRRIQCSLDPYDWKPVPAVGIGVREVRVTLQGAYRVFYLASLPEAVYVLHAFEKKSRKTVAKDVEIGRARFRLLLTTRRENRGTKRKA